MIEVAGYQVTGAVVCVWTALLIAYPSFRSSPSKLPSGKLRTRNITDTVLQHLECRKWPCVSSVSNVPKRLVRDSFWQTAGSSTVAHRCVEWLSGACYLLWTRRIIITYTPIMIQLVVIVLNRNKKTEKWFQTESSTFPIAWSIVLRIQMIQVYNFFCRKLRSWHFLVFIRFYILTAKNGEI